MIHSMTRRFLPVGQGAFYLEQFKGDERTYNVVYDCGSTTSVELVKKQIKSNFKEDETIDAVFISHVHDDHINGLEYLMEYCDVKLVVLPYTKPADVFLLKLDYFCCNKNADTSGFIYNLIENPQETLKERKTKAYYILNDDDISNDNISNDNISDDSISDDSIKDSGKNLANEIFSKDNDNNKLWELVPFNLEEKSRKEDFEKAFRELVGTDISIKDIVENWNSINKDTKQAIKKAYNKVKDGVNANSLVLFSGVTDDNTYQVQCLPSDRLWLNIPSDLERAKYSGCLYTGDYNTKAAKDNYSAYNSLMQKFYDYWKYIGCVQVPHHGSHWNFNEELAYIDAYFVISCGIRNRYRHPSSEVIKSLYLKNKYPNIVTEDSGSEAKFYVKI